MAPVVRRGPSRAGRLVITGRDALLAANQGIAFETVFLADDQPDFVARQAAGASCGCSSAARAPRINAARPGGV
jgi:hypothetical protein